MTIEPGISVSQTDEMQRQSLQLVVPSQLHATFTPEQAGWLMTFAAFADLVRERQRAAGL
ncbi:MAG: type II restriction endonuclease [Paracoccaceae bacterium]